MRARGSAPLCKPGSAPLTLLLPPKGDLILTWSLPAKALHLPPVTLATKLYLPPVCTSLPPLPAASHLELPGGIGCQLLPFANRRHQAIPHPSHLLRLPFSATLKC